MKIENAAITILVSAEGTEIVIRDENAVCDFVRVKLTPVQFSQALSRLAQTKCEAEVFGLDRIGKKHECRSFQFEIPKDLASYKMSEMLSAKCVDALESDGFKDWTPDSYFGSRDSFGIKQDGSYFARTTIRRWI